MGGGGGWTGEGARPSMGGGGKTGQPRRLSLRELFIRLLF
jgi:hypothetical protein